MDADPRAKEFFAEVGEDLTVRPSAPGQAVLFSQLNLSRPLLRAVEAMGYVTPTAVQVHNELWTGGDKRWLVLCVTGS